MEQSPWRLVWDDSLSLGVPELDEDHRRFISVIDDLNHAIISRQDKSEIQRVLNLVLTDAESRFEHEERVLSEHGYPEFREHSALHTEVTHQLLGMMDKFNSADRSYDWVEKALLVRKLVVDHLIEEDMKFRGFLKSRTTSAG